MTTECLAVPAAERPHMRIDRELVAAIVTAVAYVLLLPAAALVMPWIS